MPFTLAHPAAILVLRPLKRIIPTSALAIGSIVPDLWYVLPGFSRMDGHSPEGVRHFCLPLGLLLWLFWEFFLAAALTEVLSPAMRTRLTADRPHRLRIRFLFVLPALWLGIQTHLCWDLLTHDAHGEFLQVPKTVEMLGRPHEAQNILQLGSSTAGCLVIFLWLLLVLRRSTPTASWKERLWPGSGRFLLGVVLLLGPVVLAVFQAPAPFPGTPLHQCFNNIGRHFLADSFWMMICWGALHGLARLCLRLRQAILNQMHRQDPKT